MSYGQYSNAPKVPKPALPAKIGKREKHVFGTGDTGVEHVWAHPLTKDGQGYSQTYGTNPQKNFYFKTDSDDTRVLYSYRDSYPIASRFDIGKRTVYLVRSGKGYSVTTASHMNIARNAVPDKANRFEVPYVVRYEIGNTSYHGQNFPRGNRPDKATHLANLADYVERIQDEIDRQVKARSSYVISGAHSSALTLRDEAKRYARVFGLKCPKLPVVPQIDTAKMAIIKTREYERQARLFAKRKAEHEAWQNYSKHGCDDYACMKCEHTLDSADVFSDEAHGWSYSEDGYSLTNCLDSDIFVLKSPYYTFAQFCSPCVPGAGNLDTPIPDGSKTYCLGHEWFEDGKAPYPVYAVATGEEVCR